MQHVGIDVPGLTPWQCVKRGFVKWMAEHPLARAVCCCFDTTEVEALVRDNSTRSEIREAMRMQRGYGSMSTCIEGIIRDVLREDAYNLTDSEDFRAATPERTVTETALVVRGNPVTTTRPFQEDPPVLIERARVIPKFAAAMALSLRAKLGRMRPTEANLMLVERKYLEVCRNAHVRDVDVVSHQQFAMNAYFGEDVLDHVGTVRRRLPSWLKRAFDIQPMNVQEPVVC